MKAEEFMQRWIGLVLIRVFRDKPSVLMIWRQCLPRNIRLDDKLQFFRFPPHFRNTVISNALGGTFLPNGEGDTDAHLYTENIVRRSRDLRIPADVAVQVDVIDSLKVA